MKHFESQLRLGSGIVLALYVTQHLLNHAFGIVSIEAAEAYRKTVGAVFQTWPGLMLLYASILFHAIIALRSLYQRSSLQLSLWQWLQILMGFSFLPLVVGHAVANRGFALLGEVDPNYFYVITSISLKPEFLVKLVILIAIIWVHMLIGLHFWLRIKPGYRRYLPYTYALAVLIPALAYIGIYRMLEQASHWLDDSARLDQIYAAINAMDQRDVDMLRALETRSWVIMAGLLVMVLAARQFRLWRLARHNGYQISHSGGREFRAMQGVSLLEALREARIPHASACGGRGRCTTCRVRVGSGLIGLPEPNDQETRALTRIKAGKDIRLACQLHPRSDLAIMPPVRGEHLAFGDTGVVIYCNSVLGAYSNFEGGPSSLAAGLTGRTPRYGLHLDRNRAATRRYRVDFEPRHLSDWGALGGIIGARAGSYWELPVLEGIESQPGSDEMKHMGAAMASYGSVPLFHVVGVTPEAATLEAVCDPSRLKAETVTGADLENFFAPAA